MPSVIYGTSHLQEPPELVELRERRRRQELAAGEWLDSLVPHLPPGRDAVGGDEALAPPAGGCTTCLPLKLEPEGGKTKGIARRYAHPDPVEAPSISFAVGGSLLSVKIPTPPVEGQRGKRGEISVFSWASARALTRKLNAINMDLIKADRIGFLTLTYPFFFVAPRAAKVHLKAFLRKLQREHGRIPLIWKMEPQKRGAPHFHLMLFAFRPEQLEELGTWAAHAWHDISGHEDPRHLAWHLGKLGNKPCLERVRSWNGAKSYGAKYLGKVTGINCEEWEHPGRWWGTRFYDDLPRQIRRSDLIQAKAKLAKRLARIWYEKQPTGRYRVEDPQSGKVFRDYLRAPVVQQLQELGFIVRPIRRKWKGSRGGMTIYAPEMLGRQICTWLGVALE